jgi:hypothetical protein
MIQCSEATKDLLSLAGKGHWILPREDPVEAKGKGAMQTFWLSPTAKKSSVSEESCTSEATHDPSDTPTSSSNVEHSMSGTIRTVEMVKKQERLINWMVDMFKEQIMKVVARQKTTLRTCDIAYKPKAGTVPLDDVIEVIVLPRYKSQSFKRIQDFRSVDLGPTAIAQLRAYVSAIATTYRANHFHNFEHACHVAMATHKFIKRIATPDMDMKDEEGDITSKLHEYTHGITSDPLTVCAILFAAMIHDCDHRGVSNTQLSKENDIMAKKYGHKSVAEQHSLDTAWNLLMEDRFSKLRACLFKNESDLTRFRQVLVNLVLATDIFDRELNDLRKMRWNKAFDDSGKLSSDNDNDLRATIVIEHIIQASDVSHTMQHWHVYRKWNRRLFLEMHAAFRAGKLASNPAEFWYAGELSFFDNYVIPLAKKLKDCNVFGVSSDECLNYAMQNRSEWERRGIEIVAEMANEG